MKERPILFSAPMVRAILDGRKTQTRRVVKPTLADSIDTICGGVGEQPARTEDIGLSYDRCQFEDSRGRYRTAKNPEWLVHGTEYPEEGCVPIRQGYGAIGDQLWVRETWGHTGHGVWSVGNARMAGDGRVIYAADQAHPGASWFSSIHMPREFSRISLEITGVRIERLHDITENDAKAEGVNRLEWSWDDGESPTNDRDGFECLWVAINGRESWAANPLVWVIEFKRL